MLPILNLATSGTTAAYAYDAGGQRVRKVVRQGAHTERRYVGGWEEWREYTGSSVTKARTTLHVMDGESRVAMIETLTIDGTPIDPGDQEPVVRFQLGNHLGSVALELDEDGGIISYEEYHPFGSTAWWAGTAATVSQKRYRFTGMERDDETGLQCHGVRYYATWLGRWVSADPGAPTAAAHPFAYCENSPVIAFDPNGLFPIVAPLLLACGGTPAGRYSVSSLMKTTTSSVEDARARFRDQHAQTKVFGYAISGLDPSYVAALEGAITAAANGNEYLEFALLDRYTWGATHKIGEVGAEGGFEGAAETNSYGTTWPSDTLTNDTSLPAIVAHEVPHLPVASIGKGFTEGEGYAVDLFVAAMLGDSKRVAHDIKIYRSPGVYGQLGTLDSERTFQSAFEQMIGRLLVLQIVVEGQQEILGEGGRPVHPGIKSMTPETAKALIAHVIASDPLERDVEALKAVDWQVTNRPEFIRASISKLEQGAK